MTTASTLAPCQRFLQQSFNLLIEAVQTRIRHATQRAAEPTATPAQLRAPARATATLEWILALARCLAGDSYYRIKSRLPSRTPRAKPPRPKPHPAQPKFSLRDALRRLGFLPPKPKHTEESRALARLRHMRKVFATQPTNVIAARLARRAGIKKTSDYWPLDLIAITQTPADWADQNPPGPDPRDDPRDEPAPEPREPAPAPTEPAPPILTPPKPFPFRLSRRAFRLAYLIPDPTCYGYAQKLGS
jgi:hypothetical protein